MTSSNDNNEDNNSGPNNQYHRAGKKIKGYWVDRNGKRVYPPDDKKTAASSSVSKHDDTAANDDIGSSMSEPSDPDAVWVNDYERSGTHVSGYWRGPDGKRVDVSSTEIPATASNAITPVLSKKKSASEASSETEMLNEDEFYGRFNTKPAPDGDTIWSERPDLPRDDRHLWTVIDTDGVMSVENGDHWVNRIGYMVTEDEWDGDISVTFDSVDDHADDEDAEPSTPSEALHDANMLVYDLPSVTNSEVREDGQGEPYLSIALDNDNRVSVYTASQIGGDPDDMELSWEYHDSEGDDAFPVFDHPDWENHGSAGELARQLRQLGEEEPYDPGTRAIADESKLSIISMERDPQKLTNYAKSAEEEDRQGAAMNPNTPADILGYLADDESVEVRRRVAGNPNADDLLEFSAQDPYEDVRQEVARNKHAPSDVLEILAEDTDYTVRLNVASNENTPASTLDDQSYDHSDEIRMQVARNASTSSITLDRLAHDSNKEVAKIARARS